MSFARIILESASFSATQVLSSPINTLFSSFRPWIKASFPLYPYFSRLMPSPLLLLLLTIALKLGTELNGNFKNKSGSDNLPSPRYLLSLWCNMIRATPIPFQNSIQTIRKVWEQKLLRTLMMNEQNTRESK